mmetsp:Transcript_31292/g.35612  ORF Transcript_31292/g.35612 Transcript_31292/m.35612 type:complete len:218 (+) Transcript_31292:218-871(+)
MQAFDSPIRCRCSIRTIAFGKAISIVSTSIVGKLKPAPDTSPPTSESSTKGPTCGLTPPSRSNSAITKEERNSGSVAPPTIAKIKQPSGLRIRLISANNLGNSFTQCSETELITKSNVPSGNGNLDSSSAFSRYVPHRSFPSTGISSSRCNIKELESNCTNFRMPPIPPSPSMASSEHTRRCKIPEPAPISSASENPSSRLISSNRSIKRLPISLRK